MQAHMKGSIHNLARQRKYYLILDTETATLPFLDSLCHDDESARRTVAIAKPIVYDIGWCIMNRQGQIIKTANYLINETFFVPSIFNTAYYRSKRPLYIKLLKEDKIKTGQWGDVMDELWHDLTTVNITAAFNATFDFKKAIPFTNQYIQHLYSEDYNEWESKQKKSCRALLRKDGDAPKNDEFLDPHFWMGNHTIGYPIVDLWGLACERLINNNKYRDFCLQHNLLSASGQYFKTSAETTFQYITRDAEFTEDHTALSDALIEADILAKILKKGKVEPGLKAFPFRELGTTVNYVRKKPKYIDTVLEALEKYIEAPSTTECGAHRARKAHRRLELYKYYRLKAKK